MSAAVRRRSALDQQVRDAEQATYEHFGITARERYIGVDTGCGRCSVRLTEIGQDRGGTPLLLLHGVGSATVLTASLLPGLAHRRVIAVDWPGHGLSGPCVLPAGLDLRMHAVTTIASVLDDLDAESADLVGHSLGAQFALYAAHDLRPRVHRVITLGAPGAALAGVRPVAMMKALALPGVGSRLLALPMSRRTFDRTQELLLGAGAFDASPAALTEALHLIAGLRGNAASIASFFRALIRAGSVRSGVHLPAVDLGRIQQPILAVWGDRDVFMTPAAAASSIVALRNVHLLRLPTAGHAPWLGAESLVGPAIARHLDGPDA